MISPFFGFPFFSSWYPYPYYYSQPVYTAPTYIAPDVTTSSVSDQSADNLRLQIQQLTNEIQQLQSQLITAGQYPATPATPAQKPVSVVVVLKDGRHIQAPGYALVGSTLWILNPDSATKISIAEVDVDATQKENMKQGINVVIPSSPR